MQSVTLYDDILKDLESKFQACAAEVLKVGKTTDGYATLRGQAIAYRDAHTSIKAMVEKALSGEEAPTDA